MKPISVPLPLRSRARCNSLPKSQPQLRLQQGRPLRRLSTRRTVGLGLRQRRFHLPRRCIHSLECRRFPRRRPPLRRVGRTWHRFVNLRQEMRQAAERTHGPKSPTSRDSTMYSRFRGCPALRFPVFRKRPPRSRAYRHPSLFLERSQLRLLPNLFRMGRSLHRIFPSLFRLRPLRFPKSRPASPMQKKLCTRAWLRNCPPPASCFRFLACPACSRLPVLPFCLHRFLWSLLQQPI